MTEQIFDFREAAEAAVIAAIRARLVHCEDCEYWDPVPASSASPEFHVCNGFLGAKIAMRAQDFCSRALRKEAADE